MPDHVLAVIPARAGSKGIPRKNLAPLGGRPLIAWTIAAALAAKSVGRVIVSTDSPEIADAARALGAEVPFLRPAELATDESESLPVLVHAAATADPDGQAAGGALLQPTSPLRTADDIDAAAALAGEDVDAVVSVATAATHPWLAMRMGPGGARTSRRPGR